MKARLLFSALLFASAISLRGQEPAPAPEPATEPAEVVEAPEDPKEKHKDSSGKLANRQDELSADVQQLALEQTVQKVIDLLKECEDIMGEATERLMDQDTGGETIAAQTEVIEKIYQAAKERQKQKTQGESKEKGEEEGKEKGEGQGQGEGEAGSAMMEMLERMMGKEVEGDGQGPPKPGDQGADQGGGGVHGLSDSANTPGVGGPGDGKQEQRRVPKAAGVAGKALPEEFRGALDAYNRGAGKLSK